MGERVRRECYGFVGGVHPPHFKRFTEHKAIEPMFEKGETDGPVPKEVVIPLQQHIGAPCKPVVKPKERVKKGQLIGEATGFVSAPIHSSVAGTVKKIESRQHPMGCEVQCVIIENDGSDEEVLLEPIRDYMDASPETLRQRVLEAGIVGMGGATFPTHVKLSPPEGTSCDTVLLNGAECEPYLTSDHRLMVEEAERIAEGLRILMHILGARQGIIGIEDNKPDAIEKMAEAVEKDADIRVVPLPVKYPQGGELSLIKACLDREVPRGKLPIHVGVVVQNVATAAAVRDAIVEGRSLYERVVTVTGGAVANPRNLLVRIGTPVEEVIEYCGGLCQPTAKVIAGGPMMGMALKNLQAPVVKGTSGIIAMPDYMVETLPWSECIKCAKCVDVCPMFLLPSLMGNAVEHGAFETAEELNVTDCKECGCCAYVCPARRPLVHWFKQAKAHISARRRKELRRKDA